MLVVDIGVDVVAPLSRCQALRLEHWAKRWMLVCSFGCIHSLTNTSKQLRSRIEHLSSRTARKVNVFKHVALDSGSLVQTPVFLVDAEVVLANQTPAQEGRKFGWRVRSLVRDAWFCV